MMSPYTDYTLLLTVTVCGGILPALFWLWFWLHEDNKSPEPRGLIIRAFLAGAVAVPLVLPFQFIVSKYVAGYSVLVFLLWACIEELFKFGATFFTIFHRREMDEPIDVVIYLITAALGFVALENVLFLSSPILQEFSTPFQVIGTRAVGTMIDTVITGNLRFMGASLLHVIASATVGIMIALVFYRGVRARFKATLLGLSLATVLHAVFNFFIIYKNGENTLIVFSILWLMIAVLMLFFEKIKTLAH